MFFDENALLPGAATITVGVNASSYISSLIEASREALPAKHGQLWQEWLSKKLQHLGVSTQLFEGGSNPSGRTCLSTVSVLRPGRGDGKEAVVLVTPIWQEGGKSGSVAMAAGLRLLEHLSGSARWLAKNVVWLAVDGGCGRAGETAVASWLEAYHRAPSGSGRRRMLLRAGRIQQAIVLEVPPEAGGAFSGFEVLMQGPWGELPNLDVVQLATWTAQRYTGTPVHLASDSAARSGAEALASALERRLGVSAPRALGLLSSMAAFLGLQLSGASTGSHSPFRAYAADAVTLRAVAAPSGTSAPFSGPSAAVRLTEVLEAFFHSCSNLLEALHHSYNMYTMIGTEMFVTPEVYLPPLGIILIALCVKAAAVKGLDTEVEEASSFGCGWPQHIRDALLPQVLCLAAAAVMDPRLGLPGWASHFEWLLVLIPGRSPVDLSDLRAGFVAASIGGLFVLATRSAARSWRKMKVVLLTILAIEGAVVGCCNWIVAYAVLLTLAPAALLCCPLRSAHPSAGYKVMLLSIFQRVGSMIAVLLAPICFFAIASISSSLATGTIHMDYRQAQDDWGFLGGQDLVTSGGFGVGLFVFLPIWCSILSVCLQHQ